jgi:hypothetical protein
MKLQISTSHYYYLQNPGLNIIKVTVTIIIITIMNSMLYTTAGGVTKTLFLIKAEVFSRSKIYSHHTLLTEGPPPPPTWKRLGPFEIW